MCAFRWWAQFGVRTEANLVWKRNGIIAQQSAHIEFIWLAVVFGEPDGFCVARIHAVKRFNSRTLQGYVYDEAATMSHKHQMTQTIARDDVISAEMQP